MHVLDSPACACGHNVEDVNHYLLVCPMYQTMRDDMMQSLSLIVPLDLICVESLLFGLEYLSLTENLKVLHSLHIFIKDTARFS